MMRENSRVAFTGASMGGLAMGDEGLVLLSDESASHVKWATGARAGEVIPVYNHDLATLSSFDLVADSLEVGSLTAFSARHTYDEGGDVAVVNTMAEQGHLASFTDIAEEALAFVEARVRNEPSFRVVLAELDDEEGERVLRLASACLIRDAFSAEGE